MTSVPLFLEHHKMLERESAISPEVIAAHGYRTVTNQTELDVLGFKPVQRRVPDLLIPMASLWVLDGGHSDRRAFAPWRVG